MGKKRKVPKPWWKERNVNALEIGGFTRDGDMMGYDRHGVNIQVEPIRKSETDKTIKLTLEGYYNDINEYGEPGVQSITKAKKIIQINSKTTQAQMKKIIKDFHKRTKRNLYEMK